MVASRKETSEGQRTSPRWSRRSKGLGYVGYHGLRRRRRHLGSTPSPAQGLKIANYADTSGNPPASKVYRAAKVIFAQPGIEAYFLGGFMYANQEQWHHAHGIVKILREELPNRPGFPCLLLLCGNTEEESLKILHEGTRDLARSRPSRFTGATRFMRRKFLARRLKAMIMDYRRRGA